MARETMVTRTTTTMMVTRATTLATNSTRNRVMTRAMTTRENSMQATKI